jgi:putative endonuclease
MLTEGMKSFWVYILASRPRGTLYVGITNDLIRRVYEHREALVEGFTKRYGVKMLVYYEQHATAIAAIQREKNIKHWPRKRCSPAIRKTGMSSFSKPTTVAAPR